MTTKQQRKIVNKFTELRLQFDKEIGQYMLVTDEGKYIDGIKSLTLIEVAHSRPTLEVTISLSK